MYKKPITETLRIESNALMDLSQGGNTSDLPSGTEGNAPKRRTRVF